jgi:hypothetical protein
MIVGVSNAIIPRKFLLVRRDLLGPCTKRASSDGVHTFHHRGKFS